MMCRGINGDRLISSISKDEIKQAMICVSYNDYKRFSKILRNVKMTKTGFIDICNVAITCNNSDMLIKFIKLYPPFWNTEIFNTLYNSCIINRRYNIINILDIFIDSANEYIENKNKYNKQVADEYNANIDKQSKRFKWKFWKKS